MLSNRHQKFQWYACGSLYTGKLAINRQEEIILRTYLEEGKKKTMSIIHEYENYISLFS